MSVTYLERKPRSHPRCERPIPIDATRDTIPAIEASSPSRRRISTGSLSSPVASRRIVAASTKSTSAPLAGHSVSAAGPSPREKRAAAHFRKAMGSNG